MTRKMLKKKDVQAYVGPELENLKALFRGLGLEESLSVLSLLEEILDTELDENYTLAAQRQRAREEYESSRDAFDME